MSLVDHLLVRSVDRIVGSAADFTVVVPALAKIAKVRILSASIPNTLYNITSANNTIYWNRAGDFSATLTPGAYGVTRFAAAVATAMQTADPTQTYNASYSDVTLKLTITCDASFYLRCTETTNAVWAELGYDTTANTSAGLTQVPDYVVRLDFPPYLLISIAELGGANTVTTANTRANFSVPMTTNSQYLEIYSPESSYENSQWYTPRDGLNRLEIRLTKPDGGAVDLNGGEWCFLLGLCRCH